MRVSKESCLCESIAFLTGVDIPATKVNMMRETRKDCYGVLDLVFPVGKEGLREIVATCFDCPDKVACLRAALNTKEGLTLMSEVVEREAPSGLAHRLRRWSEKKQLSRLMKQKKESSR
ncbi:MAG: hypothetical protein SV686_03630 [Thermodesulfobacteriota bacterium]|nr:hypothetical protein [Thermodesulfobacteriota bacterium]